MIIGLAGNLGRGKTLGMTMLGHYFYYDTKYDRVVSNYQSDLTTDYIQNPVEFDDKSQNVEGIYLLDEIWAWIDSRKSGENELMNEVVINSRKRGCLMIYTVQSMDMIDKRLRNNTDYYGICRHYDSTEVGMPVDVAQIILFNNDGRHVRTFTYKADTYYGTYDTQEEVATKSDADMYEELMEEHYKDVKAEKFEHKNELISHLSLKHDLSQSKSEDVANEVFRQVKNEEKIENGELSDDDEFEAPETEQKGLKDAVEG